MRVRASVGARDVLTAASLVLCLLALPAHAQDGGVVLDAPRVLKQSDGTYLFNQAAFTKVDSELKRLQQVERVHKGEPSWAQPVLVGMLVGFVFGAASAVVADMAISRLVPAAPNPSP